MKQSTIRLILVVSVLYFAVLFLLRGFLPADFNVPLYFLVGPMLLVVVILVSDLTSRAAIPTKPMVSSRPGRRLSWEVQRLTRQIEVGTNASSEYYETVLLARLREILVERVCLETGMERESVREILKNKVLGPALLRDRELYRLLYSGAPARGSERVKTLERAVAAVEAWKP